MKTKLFQGLLSYLTSALMLCAAVLCSMFCLITGLNLPVDSNAVLQVGTLLCVAAALIWSLPKFRFLLVSVCLIPLSALLARDVRLALEGTYTTLINGGAVVGSSIIMAYREIFPYLDQSRPIAALTEAETIACATWFCFFIMALLALFLGWALIRRRSLWLTVGGTLPLLAIPLAITGIPATLPLIGLLTCWLVLLLTRKATGTDRWAYQKLTLFLLPSCLLFLSAVSLLIPKEQDATRPDALTDVRTSLVGRMGDLAADMIENGWLSGIRMGTVADQSTSLDFSQIGSLRQTSKAYFTVTTTSTQPLYLRRLSLGVYDGAGWSQFPNANKSALWDVAASSYFWVVGGTPASIYAKTVSLYLSSSSYAVEEYTAGFESMTISGSDSSFLYTTYQTVPTLIGFQETQSGIAVPDIWVEGDSYLTFLSENAPTGSGEAADSADQYTVYFLSADEASLASQMNGQAGALSSSQLYAYTDLSACSPEETDALYSLLSTIDFSTVSQSAVPQLTMADLIVDQLQSVAVYDLAVKRVDGDFVLNFLTTGKGYCVHFATTAALLFRAAGIPARYVSGYLVDPGDADKNGNISVRGTNAHAWVEIFIDGYGWYPIEATPSDGLQLSASQTDGESEETLTDPEHPDDQADETTQSEDNTPSKQPQTSNVGSSDETKGISTGLKLLLVTLALLLLIGGTLLRRKLAQRSRQKRFLGENPNRNAIELWSYLQKLSHYYDVTLPPLCEVLAKKAMFSQHTLTQEEVEVLLLAARAAIAELNDRLSLWRKFVFRYVRALN